jgi:sec-independent protein translocase protein TatA
MGSFSLMHWLVFGAVAIVVLGGGRFSNLMGDVAKGIKSFKKGMAEEDEPAAPAPKPAVRLQQQPPLDPNPDHSLHPMPDDRPHN